MINTVTRQNGLYIWRGKCARCGGPVMRGDRRSFTAPGEVICLECMANRKETPEGDRKEKKEIKALSLWQPWATLVAIGAKRVETRSWTTEHRGLLAIHATQAFPKEAQTLCNSEPFKGALRDYWNEQGVVNISALPRGAVLAVVYLDLISTTEGCVVEQNERCFGDYSPGRYAWFLSSVCQLAEPIPCQGHQKLWPWDISTSWPKKDADCPLGGGGRKD